MIRILALTTLNNSAGLKQACDELRARYGQVCSLQKIYFKDYESPDAPFASLHAAIREADLVLVDVRSDSRLGREIPGLLREYTGTVVVLVGAGPEIFALTRMGRFRGSMMFKPGADREFSIDAFLKAKKFSQLTKALGRLVPFGMLKDMRIWMLAQEYYAEGGAENLKNLLCLLLKKYGRVKTIRKVPPPKAFPPYVLYHPDGRLFTDPAAYRAAMGFDPNRQTVGMLFHSGMHFDDSLPAARALCACLHDKVNLLLLFSNIEHNMNALYACFSDIDLFVNLQYFRLWGGPYGGRSDIIYDYLRKKDVPLLTGLRAFETELDGWRQSEQGINPIETVLGVILPELDGAIGPYFISGLAVQQDATLGVVKTPVVVPDRVAALGGRIEKWLSLRKKTNAEKRLALITYSYPPGEENLASAGYLDVFASLQVFLENLTAAGYRVTVPEQQLRDFFLAEGIVNSPAFMEKKGIRISNEQYRGWFAGLPEDVQRQVISRWGDPPGAIMIDRGDILLPGIALGNLFLGVQPSRGVHEDAAGAYHDKGLSPHHQYLAYYFYLEREFAADAVVHFGMHGTVEFTAGKQVALSEQCFPDLLIGSLPHIYYYWIGNPAEATIAKRRSYALCISHASPAMKVSGLYDRYGILEDLCNQYEQDRAGETLDLIRTEAGELHLPSDIPQLRRELYALKNRLIPYGLHVMDRQYEGEALLDYLMAVLRTDRELPSLFKTVAERDGLVWDDIKETSAADLIAEKTRDILNRLISGNPPAWLDSAYADYALRVIECRRKSQESRSLLRALEGRYILPARAGDPVRDPAVYPSGRAMYAFDPRLIPTVSAEVRGRAAAQRLIAYYRLRKNRYPETVAVVLWGFETMKTGGDTVASILALLGLRIRHRKSLWIKDLEVVPLGELRRPRIDVLVSMCGIFRDTFGTHIDLLNRAIAMVAALDEPPEQNFIKKHCVDSSPGETAPALPRIFGPSPAEYATELPALIESSRWETEQELADHFTHSMSYAYTATGAQHNAEAFSKLLSSVDLVTQERDTTEYDITDLDHYYEFLGGLSRSVQAWKGERAEIAVVDQTQDEPDVADLQTAIERATRSRTLNPRWIEGMLAHDFHGAKKIHDRVEYLLGFAATTGSVRNWVFDAVADRYIFDEAMREKLRQNNPYAARKIGEVLLETHNRGYWQVDPEQLEKLRNIIIDMEGYIE